MAPAQQRLDAGYLAGVQIDLGLVMQQQLVALQRVPEVRFHREPLDRPGPGVAGEEPEAVLAVALDQVHRRVGVRGQGLNVGAVDRIDRRANRGGNVTFVIAELDRFTERSQQVSCDTFDVLAPCDILQKEDELISAKPCDDVASAHAAPQPGADLGQQPVARVMAEGIVDDLEAVEIDEQHGQLPVLAPRQLDRKVQQLVEQLAVRQVGEAVVRGEIFDALIRDHFRVGTVEILQRERDIVGKTLQQFGQFGRECVALPGQKQQRAKRLSATHQRQCCARHRRTILGAIVKVAVDRKIGEIIVADARLVRPHRDAGNALSFRMMRMGGQADIEHAIPSGTRCRHDLQKLAVGPRQRNRPWR